MVPSESTKRRRTEGVDQVKIHESITIERVIAAVESEMFGTSNPGFCTACGEDADGCEPDARNYECECCGAHAVFGAAEVLTMIGA